MNIAIYIYDQAEVLDFSGPFEVFATASRLAGAAVPFHVFLVAETAGSVTARGGYRVIAEHGLEDHPPIDVLIVAGGAHSAEMDKPRVREWILGQSRSVSLLASVCTGVFLLAGAGVAGLHEVTTHWEDIPELRKRFPRLKVMENVPWTDQGHVVTSAGITAGIDMSLHLLDRLAGRELAERTARQMEFSWTADSGVPGDEKTQA